MCYDDFLGRLNHSCNPNTIWCALPNRFVLSSTKEIPAGSEITMTYIPSLYGIADDNRLIEDCKAMGFECKCDAHSESSGSGSSSSGRGSSSGVATKIPKNISLLLSSDIKTRHQAMSLLSWAQVRTESDHLDDVTLMTITTRLLRFYRGNWKNEEADDAQDLVSIFTWAASARSLVTLCEREDGTKNTKIIHQQLRRSFLYILFASLMNAKESELNETLIKEFIIIHNWINNTFGTNIAQDMFKFEAYAFRGPDNARLLFFSLCTIRPKNKTLKLK
jgi:hypothetical protein